MNAALWLILACWGTAATGATVESVLVATSDGRYRITMSARLAVPARAAFAVMTDFSNLGRINPNIVLVQPLPGNRLRTIVQFCLLFFCKSVEQVQEWLIRGPGHLLMRVIPELSDFEHGRGDWRIQPLGPKSSRLRFTAELDPAFWVPPLIGPWIIRRVLKEQAVITSKGIERVARELALPQTDAAASG